MRKEGTLAHPLDAWELKSLERFANFTPPTLIDKEVVWDKTRVIVSKTDQYGVIEYVNDAFIDVSGYDEHELISLPHSIVRHPDMPRVLFKVLWDNLLAGKVIRPIVKNLAKSGRYYWVVADFEIKKNPAGEITHFYSRRRVVAPEVVARVSELYGKLLQIEEVGGISASEKYLNGYLEDIGKNYNEFIEDLIIQYTPGAKKEEQTATPEPEAAKKGFFSKFFGW